MTIEDDGMGFTANKDTVTKLLVEAKHDELDIECSEFDGGVLTKSTSYQATFNTGAKKDLEGKPRFDLIPPEAVLALAETYTLGTKKYSDRNWEKGIPFSTCLGALKRHLNEFELGEMVNSRDGSLEHIAHAAWWAIAILTFIRRGRTDLNDLPHYSGDLNNDSN